MPEIIAIVGRPNVGKSTLFNRLSGRRSALVDPTPGLTRDRREAETDIGPRRVRLVDTAGLEDAKSGSIQSRMRAQTEAAIASADAILFVLDARAGVMPEDEQFARLVRASGKPVILVSNKSEGRSAEAGFYDAFKLGLGEPIAISAEHGDGIGDLVRAVLAALPSAADASEAAAGEVAADAPLRPLKVAIIGRPNAGKSTLLNALVGSERVITGPEPGLTRDAIEVPFEWRHRAISLFDTAGLRKKSRITERTEKLAAHDALNAVRFAEVVVLLVDAEHPLEKQDLSLGDLV
ncbi:MAG: ribosome biogenesis GTPase Der, partial [Hyphomicrobiaceae bacterium]